MLVLAPVRGVLVYVPKGTPIKTLSAVFAGVISVFRVPVLVVLPGGFDVPSPNGDKK